MHVHLSTDQQRTELAAHFATFLKEQRFIKNVRPETVRGYAAVFSLFMKLMPEITDASLLSSDMIIEFFGRLARRDRIVGKGTIKTGVKSSTVRTYWTKLDTFFKWLQQKGLILKSPLSGMQCRQPTYDDTRALASDDIRKIYTAVTLHSPKGFILRRDTAMISLLLFCGLRLGEFISVEVSDIDFEKRRLTVRGITSKSKRIRFIPIHPTLLMHLKDYLAERNKRNYKTQYLVASSAADRQLSRHGLKHWVKNLSMKSGVKFHLHQFRHAFACNLAIKNVHAVKIQRLLGHASLNMTMTYLRSVSADDLYEDILKLSI